MSITIEEGKYYSRADGTVHGPARRSFDADYPWKIGAETYDNSGRYRKHFPNDNWNLVAEASAPVEDDGFVTREAPEWVKGVEAEAAAERDESIVGIIDGQPVYDIKTVIADEAKRIVSGARRSAYGKPEDNFERIARFWDAYFKNTGRDVNITAADVSPLMRLVKEARICESPDHLDSHIDLVGYALTGAEVNGVKSAA